MNILQIVLSIDIFANTETKIDLEQATSIFSSYFIGTSFFHKAVISRGMDVSENETDI